VRVIAGIAKGRRLRAASGTRPTADSVKEALFSTLGPRVAGGRVLDLYAGSGALGIEALSRGAETATFVERDPRAVSVIRTNLEATGFSGRARVVEAPVERFLASGPGGAWGPGGPDWGAFDLVLADPPYAEDPVACLARLSGSALLARDVLVALEVAAGSLPLAPAGGLVVQAVRRYGDSAIVYAERHDGGDGVDGVDGRDEGDGGQT
jgi:16S rRNA (guanine966-N2)-methyltransferase